MRETTRAEFEAYEKKVETALFRLERSVGPDDRNDFDEVASVAREHVNGRRELMELYEMKGQAQAEQGTATEHKGRERRDDANDQWDAAVAKHGEAVVEAANDILMDIETGREGLDRIE
ncbi:MAG: conjugal transfer protein TraA, partial [Mesorhizobium sp.]